MPGPRTPSDFLGQWMFSAHITGNVVVLAAHIVARDQALLSYILSVPVLPVAATRLGWNTISQRDTLAGVEPRPDEKVPAAGAGRSRTAHAASCSDVARRVATMDGCRPCPRSNPGARSGLRALLLCDPGGA